MPIQPRSARALDKPKRRRPLVVTMFLLAPAVLLAGLYLVVGYRHFLIPSGSMEPTLMGPRNGYSGDRVRAEWLFAKARGPRRGEIWVFKAPPVASPDERLFNKRVVAIGGDRVEILPQRLLVDGRTAVKLSADYEGLLQFTSEGPRPQVTGRTCRIEQDDTHILVEAVDSAPEAALESRLSQGERGERGDHFESMKAVGAEDGVRGIVRFVGGSIDRILVVGKQLEVAPSELRVNDRPVDEPYLKEPMDYVVPPLTLAEDEVYLLGDNRNNSSDSHVWGPVKANRMVARIVFRFWPPQRFGPI